MTHGEHIAADWFTIAPKYRTKLQLAKHVDRALTDTTKELVETLDYLLQQTVDQDLKHGISLTEGEEDARQRALAIIAKVAA
jgi:CRISPR/Cas system CSM-associated protein Csm2 small subunit